MKFIAHRGYSKLYLDNSIKAFDAVLKHPQCGKSIIGIELDIQLLADDSVPVFHDEYIDDDNGKRQPLRDLSFEELKARTTHLDIPSFQEALDLVNHKTGLFVELKSNGADTGKYVDRVLDILKEYNPRKGDIILHSFSQEIMSDIIRKTKGMNYEYGFLFCELDPLKALSDEFLSSLDYLHPQYEFMFKNEDFIFSFGLPVHTWTVNSKEDLDSVLSMKNANMVRAVITDDLNLVNG